MLNICITIICNIIIFLYIRSTSLLEEHPNLYSSNFLGRFHTVHPNNQECFYLRLLLIVNVRGPKSFQKLRTVNGEVCAIYR